MYTTLLRTYSAWIAAALITVGFALAGPIAQPANYHAFADHRALGALPYAADVLSNLGFLLAGLYGLSLPGRRDPAYAVLCAALIATFLGSSWYHWMPDDVRLVWDRLPIAIACAAVLARVLGRWLAVLVAAAVASVAWWVWSGDLRPYLLLQLLPLTVAPLLQWQRCAPAPERRCLGLAIGLYVLAKLCELADHALFDLLGVVSGHTLKHLLASAAALLLVLAWRAPAAARGAGAPAACRNSGPTAGR